MRAKHIDGIINVRPNFGDVSFGVIEWNPRSDRNPVLEVTNDMASDKVADRFHWTRSFTATRRVASPTLQFDSIVISTDPTRSRGSDSYAGGADERWVASGPRAARWALSWIVWGSRADTDATCCEAESGFSEKPMDSNS